MARRSHLHTARHDFIFLMVAMGGAHSWVPFIPSEFGKPINVMEKHASWILIKCRREGLVESRFGRGTGRVREIRLTDFGREEVLSLYDKLAPAAALIAEAAHAS